MESKAAINSILHPSIFNCQLSIINRVKYAVNTETNEAVAIKILDKDKIQTRNMGAQIKKEISIMKMINHHHVVGVRDVFATSAKIFIVLEFVGGGELFDKIANEGKLPEEKARFYFKQLVEGLEHCHSNGICHRDLKPEVSRTIFIIFPCLHFSLLSNTFSLHTLLTLLILPVFVFLPFQIFI